MRSGVCLYPGSFDPVTLGHMDIIRRAAKVFEKVYVGVLINPDKKGSFTNEERVDLLKRACADLPNVEIVSFTGLTAELCRKLDIRVLVRGLRGGDDLTSEMRMAKINAQLLPGLETVFLGASSGMEAVSSSLVREIASFGGDISALVPKKICQEIQNRFKRS